jgi:hypothetical protein
MKNNGQNYSADTIYKQLCESYRAIDEFRAKLLGFLPLATGTGIFFLFSNNVNENCLEEYLTPIGIFGFVVTLGLFSYELYGIKKCTCLIKTGISLEFCLEIEDGKFIGQFIKRPSGVLGFINEPFAAGLIYPAVLSVWMYMALLFKYPFVAKWIAIILFVVGFSLTTIYTLRLKKMIDDPNFCK